MYDIRQFKTTLYLLLIAGISGFSLAGRLPGVWCVAVACILLHAWLGVLDRVRPISRLTANLFTLLALLYVAREWLNNPLAPVVIIGEFLVFLQLVKLWEARANRDYAQLLILSLLLMVAASMNTASLWFGLLLVGYLFLSLYCCLLFHLKVETDAAKAAMPLPEEKISPASLRQDQRYLSASMRRLTGLVATFAMSSAVLVFLLFPRGNGAGMLGPLQSYRSASALTGFSDQVSFQDVARITQNHDTIAFVKLWQNGKVVGGNQTLFLRGLTLDNYRRPNSGSGWEWVRSAPAPAAQTADPQDPLTMPPNSPERWRQQVALWPTHTDVLFALAGPISFRPRQQMKVRVSSDGALQSMAPLNERVDYEVVSTNDLGNGNNPTEFRPAALLRQEFPRIYQFASRPEVSGSDAGGPLAPQRLAQTKIGPLDEKIAANIAHYLRTSFAYTLDLTDEGRLHGREPLELFLYDWKKGHCEYFAGAMTLMCQTLGIQARMVIGFKIDGQDYIELNDQYAVHDSDAHAWVEVRTSQGWKTFDPTSSLDVNQRAATGMLGRARHLLEYLEYTYANAVIAYDSQNRHSVIASVETGLASSATKVSAAITNTRDYLLLQHAVGFWNVSSVVLSCFLFLMLTIVLVALAWFLLERARLRRRAARMGMESLPEDEQLRLARQLGFYDDLVRLLGRHRIARPVHCTPLEFSQSLSFLPAEAYDTIRRLTQLFYRVRYGGAELPPPRRRRLGRILDRLSRELDGRGPVTG
jgi:transglutaminase-like putative cysteine protease